MFYSVWARQCSTRVRAQAPEPGDGVQVPYCPMSQFLQLINGVNNSSCLLGFSMRIEELLFASSGIVPGT